jgi:hypothetical protein
MGQAARQLFYQALKARVGMQKVEAGLVFQSNHVGGVFAVPGFQTFQGFIFVAGQGDEVGEIPDDARKAARDRAAFCVLCRFAYGTTKLTDVPQFAKPSLVPSQVPSVRVNSDPTQFAYWM